jgi:hypothetical protein
MAQELPENVPRERAFAQEAGRSHSHEQRRRHIHEGLDASELPVHHETRRSGRPYTLILSKTKELFEQEARERRSWESDLAWLRRQLGAT